MYHPPGEYVTDFCIVRHDDLYHLFHIRGERGTWSTGYRELDLGHATSTDLCRWTQHDPLLPAGPTGSWDECGNWAPHIIEMDGTYHCFYTGSDTRNNQAIGLATSTDLFSWTKHATNPVVVPGVWSDRDVGYDVAGRDAMVFHDRVNGCYLLYYTATMSDGCVSQNMSHLDPKCGDLCRFPGEQPADRDANRRITRLIGPVERSGQVHCHGLTNSGLSQLDFSRVAVNIFRDTPMSDGRACIAHAQSTDLVHWTDLGPTYIEEDRSYNRLESAYVVEHEGLYYLLYSAKGGPNSKGFSPHDFAHFDIVYQISDSPRDGWTRPSNHELLTEWTCASEHPTFDGVTYMLYIVQEEIEGVWGASVLSDPKRLDWMPDGSVRIREHVPAGDGDQPIFEGDSCDYDQWVQHGAEWWQRDAGEVAVSTSDEDAYFMDTWWGGDLAMSVEISIQPSAVASLMVHANPSAMAGYRVCLDFDRGVVGLHLHVPGQASDVIQERAIQLNAERWHMLKVVAQGEFLDIYVDETLWIVRHHRTYIDGCYGLHARGDVRFRNLKVCYAGGSNPQADWQSRCRPRHLFP